jgi:hypothetical protein
MDCFVASLLAMTGMRTCALILTTRNRLSLAISVSLSEESNCVEVDRRSAGLKAGAARAPACGG